jgi:hypothetical protein
MEKASLLGALRFRSVGPEVQGGRVVDIEAPAAHPEHLVVAFASGGLWRTENRGARWTPLFDQESSIANRRLRDRTSGRPGPLRGHGENNSSRTSYSGTGVFKTTDGSATCTRALFVDDRDNRKRSCSPLE